MIKRIPALLMILTFAVMIISACSYSPEEAAKEACECIKKFEEAEHAADDDAKTKLTDEAQDCENRVKEKIKDKDEEFQKAFAKALEGCKDQLKDKPEESSEKQGEKTE